MIKQVMNLISFCILVTGLVACNNGGNTNNQKVAQTPLSMDCLNGTAYCNTGAYNNLNGYGYYSYPGYVQGYNYYAYAQQNGFCNCPVGTLPTYNSSYGLGCVRADLIQPYLNYSFYWTFGYYSNYVPANQGLNSPQVSNLGTVSYQNGGTCQSQLNYSCFVDQAGSCGNQGTCQPTAGGSRLGICVR